MKSGYQFWVNSTLGSNSVPEEKGWNKLWNLRLPHKVRTFLWRFCQNNVPVRKLPRSRGVDLPIICSMCERDIEHLLHIFFDCGFAAECSQRMGLVYNMESVEFAPSWLLDRINNENPEIVERIVTVLWGIWFARNQKVWEGKVITAATAMDISRNQIVDWQTAMSRKASQNSRVVEKTKAVRITRWKPPEMGQLKLNVDASLFVGENSFSVGMLIRNEVGGFVRGKRMKIHGEMSVLEAEAQGSIQEGIEMGGRVGFARCGH